MTNTARIQIALVVLVEAVLAAGEQISGRLERAVMGHKARKTRLSDLQRYIMDSIKESGDLEVCALVNTVFPQVSEKDPDRFLQDFSGALRDLWKIGAVALCGAPDLERCLERPRVETEVVAELVSHFVRWDRDRGYWVMTQAPLESAEIVLTRRGEGLLEQ